MYDHSVSYQFNFFHNMIYNDNMSVCKDNKFITCPSTCLPHAKPLSKEPGLYTYSSFYSKKANEVRSTSQDTQSTKTLIKEFTIIDMMRKQSLMDQSINRQTHERNMTDILHLIKQQKHELPPKKRAIDKPKRWSINQNCMNIYDNINETSQLTNYTISPQSNTFNKRSISDSSSKQPTKVKIMKKMLLFYKQQQFYPTKDQFNHEIHTDKSGLQQKRHSKLSPLNRTQQNSSLDKIERNLNYKPKLNTFEFTHEQSVICKGQIVNKQGNQMRRKTRLRQLNTKQSPIQPIFLQQF